MPIRIRGAFGMAGAADDQEESVVMDRIACGDQGAFQDVFDRLSGDVFKLSYSLLLDRAAAEDAAQESFVRLWQRAVDWRPEASIKTWLLTIARNVCLDLIRKRKNDLKKYQELYKEALSSAPEGDAAPAENRIDRKKCGKLLKNALFTLPERQREAITLVYYMEVHNADAAHIMGMKAAAFDSLLARARKNLREMLDGQKFELEGCFYGME